MGSRSTSLLLATLALNTAVGSFAASPTVVAERQLKPRAFEPSHRLFRRHLGVEPRSEYDYGTTIIQLGMEVTSPGPANFELVFYTHGKYRHKKYCPVYLHRHRHVICTCKHKNYGEWKGWEQIDHSGEGSSSDHEEFPAKDSTIPDPVVPPFPSGQSPGSKDIQPSLMPSPTAEGGPGATSASDVPSSDSAAPSASEQPPPVNSDATDPQGSSLSDVTSPKVNSTGNPSPSFNTSSGAPVDAPASGELNAPVKQLGSSDGPDSNMPNPSQSTPTGAPLPPTTASSSADPPGSPGSS